MNEPNQLNPNSGMGGGSTDDQAAIPMGQKPVETMTSDQKPSGSSPALPEGQDPSSEHTMGVIPKAAEAAEKAAEKGLEKTSSVVGSTIDKVADAAIGALGGKPRSDGQN